MLTVEQVPHRPIFGISSFMRVEINLNCRLDRYVSESSRVTESYPKLYFMSTTPTTVPSSVQGPVLPPSSSGPANSNVLSSATPTGPPANVPIETYIPNERVLCYHGPLIYEAKVMKVKVFEDNNNVVATVGPHYLVHYKGWKQTSVYKTFACIQSLSFSLLMHHPRCRWDEWVPPSRLLKMTEENLAEQKSLQQKPLPTGHGVGAGRGAGRGGGGAGGPFGGPGSKEAVRGRKEARGTKRGRDEVCTEDLTLMSVFIKRFVVG
jgi:hypothetical protein